MAAIGGRAQYKLEFLDPAGCVDFKAIHTAINDIEHEDLKNKILEKISSDCELVEKIQERFFSGLDRWIAVRRAEKLISHIPTKFECLPGADEADLSQAKRIYHCYREALGIFIESDIKEASSLDIGKKPKELLQEELLFMEQTELKEASSFINGIEKIADCFAVWKKRKIYMAYAWPTDANAAREKDVQSFLGVLKEHLVKLGFEVSLDISSCEKGESLYKYMQTIKDCDTFLLFGTESLYHKLRNTHGAALVCEEVRIALRELEQAEEKKILLSAPKLLPVLLTGSLETSFPPNFQAHFNTILFPEKGYYNGIKALTLALSGWMLYYEKSAFESTWNQRIGSELLEAINGVSSGFDDKREECLSRYRKSLAGNCRQNAILHPASNPNLNIKRCDTFFGRLEELADLHKELEKNLKVAIVGLGGMGKTELLAEYSKKYRGNYDYIEIVVVEGNEGYLDEIKLFLSEFIPKISITQEQSLNNYLLILDGVNSEKEFEEITKLLDSKDRGIKILLSSRRKNVAKKYRFKTFDLNVFCQDTATSYLLDSTSNFSKGEAGEIVKELCFAPIALKYGSRLLEETNADLCSFKSQLSEGKIEYLNSARKIAGEKKIFAKNELYQDFSLRSPVSFLLFSAYFSPLHISSALLRKWGGQARCESLDKNKILSSLMDLSLVCSNRRGYYFVYPVVKKVEEACLSTEQKESQELFALRALNELAKTTDQMDDCRAMVEYVLGNSDSQGASSERIEVIKNELRNI